jgi:hypothetical protein
MMPTAVQTGFATVPGSEFDAIASGRPHDQIPTQLDRIRRDVERAERAAAFAAPHANFHISPCHRSIPILADLVLKRAGRDVRRRR